MLIEDKELKNSMILEKVISILEMPGAWIQGYRARDNFGVLIASNDPLACQFCFIGAYDVALSTAVGRPVITSKDEAFNPLYEEVVTAFKQLYNVTPVTMNDKKATTQEIMVAALRGVVAHLSAKEMAV